MTAALGWWDNLTLHQWDQLLAVPHYRINTYGRRAFSVAGSTVWNSHPDFIQDQTITADCFRRLIKIRRIGLLDTSALSALEVVDDYCTT